MESEFQFSNPALTRLEFGLNEGYKGNKSEVKIDINMKVKVKRNDCADEAMVELEFTSGMKNDSTPFYIIAVESACFRWDESLDEEVVDILLKQNAPSLLLSYLRPIIAQITMASPYDAYNIPFINFTQNKGDS